MTDKQQSGFDTTFAVTRFVMGIEGIWPGGNSPKTGIARFTFLPAAVMMAIFINVAQTLELPRVGGNLNVIIDILTFADIPIFIALVKHLGVTYNREVLRKLLISISEDWKEDKKESELKVMWRKARLSRIFTMVEVSLAAGRLIIHTIRISYSMLNPKIDPVTKTLLRPYYMRGYFIYDSQSTPAYEITWTCQFIAVAFSGCAFSSADALFVAVLFHLCGQLINLQAEFRDIGKYRKSDRLEFIREMGRIIKKHRRICGMADTIEYCFNKMFLVQVTASSVIVCLHGYSLVMVLFEEDDVLVELMFMAFFTLGFMYSMFVYCYVAERLSTESLGLGTAIFDSTWYDLSPNDAKTLLIPLQRTGKPLEVTAGKFVVFSLNLFSNIVKTSAGYLSMLLAVRDKV